MPICRCRASSISSSPTGTARAATCRPRNSACKAARALEDEDPGAGARAMRRLHRRADPGCRRRHHPARDTTGPRSSASAGKYDLLLIADEVICGFGRTGHWFASELYGIKAGLHDPGQGHHLRLCAALGGHDRRPGGRGADRRAASSTMASPIPAIPSPAPSRSRTSASCREEKLVERVHDETGPYLAKRLQELLDHPLVGEVRAPGLHRRHRAGEGQEDAPDLPARRARSARSAATIASPSAWSCGRPATPC